jgi:quercetin dioxygenase-like cupin family protein
MLRPKWPRRSRRIIPKGIHACAVRQRELASHRAVGRHLRNPCRRQRHRRPFCLIDMHIPPGGGPPPHRHDFEEMFSVLEGEIEAIFRGKKAIIRSGDTINIPANAPHQFQNKSEQPARLLCLCSPAGQEEFFMEVGVSVATRTTPPPPLDEDAEAAFIAKVKALAPK